MGVFFVLRIKRLDFVHIIVFGLPLVCFALLCVCFLSIDWVSSCLFMAKGFRLSKGLLKTLKGCSNKEAKGKALALSHDIDSSWRNRRSFSALDMERALVMDDFGLDWELDSRMVKAREGAKARMRDIFYPSYEPWEEINYDSDLHSEMDHSVSGQSDLEFSELSRGKLIRVDENHPQVYFQFDSAKGEACEAFDGE